MKDYMIKGIAGDGAIRAFAATTKHTVQKAATAHHTSPVASAALGRMLTAAAIMGSTLKGEKDLLTLQIRGIGPLKGIVVSSNHKSQVKGYVFQPDVSVPGKYPGKLDVSGAIGQGYLSVIKDIGLKEPYAGQIQLVSGEIAEDLTYYFAQSEQTPSAIGLGVLVDVDYSIKQSGGFMIQLLPDAPEELVVKLEQKLSKIPNITQMLDEKMTPEDILHLILGDFSLKILERQEVDFYCNCDKNRVEKALISIGAKEIEKIINEDQKANLHCHFCGKEYFFTKEELTHILEEAK